jgi:hypothetical protein
LKCFQDLDGTLKADGPWKDLLFCCGLRHERAQSWIGASGLASRENTRLFTPSPCSNLPTSLPHYLHCRLCPTVHYYCGRIYLSAKGPIITICRLNRQGIL